MFLTLKNYVVYYKQIKLCGIIMLLFVILKIIFKEINTNLNIIVIKKINSSEFDI